MIISPSLLRVQQRIIELHPRLPSPAVGGASSPISPSGPASPAATAFSDLLAQKMATGVSTGAQAHSHVTPSTDVRSYDNGEIPASALTSIGVGHHRLAGPAAQAFTEMRGEAAAAGIDIRVTDSYRSYDDQVDLVRRKGLYSQGGLAAKPGTSNHGWGLAVDLDLGARAQAWMRANAGRYGFVEDTPREPWHWAYHGT